MRKISRSNTLSFQKMKGILNNTLVNNNKNEYNKESNINDFNDEIKNKEHSMPKKLSSDESNLISINYISEYRLQKKKKEHEMDIEIENLGKILQSNRKIEEMKNENSLVHLLTQKTKRYSEENKEKLIEIIKYILLKHDKTDHETLIIKTYFLKNEKLASLILPSNLINSESLVNKLSNQLKFEEFKRDSIICKEGDKGEKLYIVLKGNSSVMVQKEGKAAECTPFEFVKYLIVLYLYQEMSMITRILYYNKQVMKVEERCILTLFIVFRFYKYYKDHNFFLSESKKPYEKDNMYEFIINEKKLKEFIYQKYDYPVEDSLYIFDYSQKVIKELFEFYERKIDDINNNYVESDDENEILIHKQDKKRSSIFFKPNDFKELNAYSYYYAIKIKRNKKLKNNKEEIFNKVFSITELSKQIIYKGNIQDYIKRVDFNNILAYIRQDYINYHDISLKLKEAKQPIKYFYYSEVNTIKEGNIFGELALNNMNKKRTATIISKGLSYFAVLSKKVYDSYLKVAQIKSRYRKMLYFTEGPIFKGMLAGTFLNKYFFRIKKIECSKGKILFNKDDLRKKIYFIIKGEFELSCRMTLNEISDIIKELGGICENKKEKYLCNLYEEFNRYYYENKINIKICAVNKNQVVGLDDMSINNKYIFDCKCLSSDETEIYEFDYSKFEEALKENDLILRNNIKYVNKRRELYIKILFTQRNSLVDLEYKKIKEENTIKKKLSETDFNKKDNILSTIMKKVEYNNKEKYKAISLFEKFKNKKMKNLKLNTGRNNSNNSNENINENSNNSKSNVKISFSNKNRINKFKSEKNIYKKNLLDKDKNKLIGKTGSIFYPKILSEKNINVQRNFGKLLNKNNTENEKDKTDLKKLENKHKKLKLLIKEINNNKNRDNIYEKTENSNILALSLNNISNLIKSFNLNNDGSKTRETRRKRGLIPIMTNNKISLKKKIKNISNINLDSKTPSLFKEYSKKYISTKTKISSPDDFYLNYQEEIFNILNKKNNKKILITALNKHYNKRENKNDNKEKINENNDINDNKNVKTENKSVSVNIKDNNNDKKNKKKKRRKRNHYNANTIQKDAGIIDFLCLDNWAEKTQFEKQFFG